MLLRNFDKQLKVLKLNYQDLNKLHVLLKLYIMVKILKPSLQDKNMKSYVKTYGIAVLQK